VKIGSVAANNRRKGFEVKTDGGEFFFPYSRLRLEPTSSNRIREVFVDAELGGEAFTYVLEDAREDSVHMDAVLDYNQDPAYMRTLLLHRLTIEALNRIEKTPLSRREITRRLDTSATQLYRLLDPANTTKSLDGMIDLLHVLGCGVDIVVKDRARHFRPAASRAPRRSRGGLRSR
jgi:hypothetical protein